MAFNNSTFVGQANYFRDAWKQGGGDVSAFVIYEPNQTTYRTELNKVLATKPDVISLSAYRPDATIILKEWFQTGQDCKFIMPGWTANEDLVKALGKEATEGIISISMWRRTSMRPTSNSPPSSASAPSVNRTSSHRSPTTW